MKKTSKILAILLAVSMIAVLFAGCAPAIDVPVTTTPSTGNDTPSTTPSTGNDTPSTTPSTGDDTQPAVTVEPLTYADGTVLRMATGYNSTKTGLSFDAEVAGEGLTLADGNTYHAGDLKPTWVEMQKRLNIVIEDKYQGNSAAKEYEYWQERLGDVDIVSGTSTKLTEAGEAGSLVNIGDYLDRMPNFKAYLDANPIIRLSITGNTSTGAIYFSPYFDGVADIERMPLMRADWVQKLLNGEGEFTAAASGTTAAPVYQPYMPTSGKVTVDVVKADGSGVETVTKDYDAAGNIVAAMNAKGAMSGVEAVNMLRNYIDTAYAGYYGTNRADLFIGQNAAWDADEMVALLRCVVANAQTLNGTDSIQGLFSREDDNTARRADMVRFAGHLFGVRGLESRKDYLYVGADNELHDARQETDAYVALERMHAMAEEGLLSKSFLDSSKESSSTMLENDMGFMSYDYNQTQTLLNVTKLQNDDGELYMAVMVPVARWFDGTDPNGVYMRFTESWRSVKTDGWGLSKAGIGDDVNKLNAALSLIDYAYTDEGMILLTYGPDAWIKTNADGSFVTYDFNGKQMPQIADATWDELWTYGKGNYTNYARQYLGSTLSFVKLQSFEYACTTEVGKIGAGYISKAIALGVIKHPELALADNAWYTSVPTILPNTKVENDEIATYTQFTSKGKFSTSKGDENILVNQIVSGYAEEGMANAEQSVAKVSGEWGGVNVLELQNDAWHRLQSYYDVIK